MATSTRRFVLLRAELRASKTDSAIDRPARGQGKRRHRARETWTAIVQAVMARRDYLSGEAAKLELTLPQAHVLQLLGAGPARTMTSIAGALGCDASNVTGIVDRLEARGLIERRNSDNDRRIKTISITPDGASLIGVLKQKMFEPPDGFARLGEEDVATLHALVQRAFPP